MQKPRLARTLHWCIVCCLLIAYTTAHYRHWYTTQLEATNWFLLVIHMNFGFWVLILSVAAIILRWRSVSRRFILPARVMHTLLFLMLLALPISGYIGTGFDLPLLGLTNLPGLIRFEFIHSWLRQVFGLLITTFMEPFSYFHRVVGPKQLLPVLVSIHIGAAIYRRFKR